MLILLVVGALLLIIGPVAAQDRLTSPYSTQGPTALRGFTEREVADLQDGAGMGLARAAELNSYPGPRHVLDAVKHGALRASAEQVRRTEVVFDRMKRDAQQLGTQILAEEALLEAAFRDRTITEAELRARLARIARLQGELRAIHLRAHLATRAILNDDQVEQYNVLRGYRGSPGPGGEPPHRH